ncbi:bifunctional phosphoribosylaminoimidazolecarboxamide formyltransferase/IMP cyclohydrolase [Buchnera aphidicola]|uniref:bifunctional phosphoribosylaminoimidazolecarboxamide formyltransferase/IMP cyclohydrolase n=1 Tax=Buchnera aphidicola TaxID=9 RepID=UPI0034641C7D
MKLYNKIIQTALISVSDKSNLIKLCKELQNKKIKIFSTHGTEKKLKENNITASQISEITQYPEIMNGQIKTIHPKIFSGILSNEIDDQQFIKDHQITTIDMIIVNFYPFNHVNINQNIEKQIDIGGPAMVRAAAKNYKHTVVLTDPSDYDKILNEINQHGYVKLETKLQLAYKAFKYVNKYDNMITKYFNLKRNNTFKLKSNNLLPNKIKLIYYKQKKLKYGENPHQKSALYTLYPEQTTGLINSLRQIHGAELSYNNIYDAYIALKCVNQFQKPSCVIVKHGTPCGAAISDNIFSAYLSAYKSDEISAFGGIIGFNTIIDSNTINQILNTQFVELIIGPEITPEALELIRNKNKIKVLICQYQKNKNNIPFIEFKTIDDGLLVQESNVEISKTKKLTIVSKKKPTKSEIKTAIFCWKIAKFCKSNAIVYGYDFKTISIGSGQTSRIDAVKIANYKYFQKLQKNQINKKNIIMASDAFFPFKDSIQEAIYAGVSCIIQPGGSIRDHEIIKTVNDNNISMIFTHVRSFYH